jgi:hypothetical protein
MFNGPMALWGGVAVCLFGSWGQLHSRVPLAILPTLAGILMTALQVIEQRGNAAAIIAEHGVSRDVGARSVASYWALYAALLSSYFYVCYFLSSLIFF